MSRILCYSVRYAGLRVISPKAVSLKCFDGSEAVIPRSQIFGTDFSSTKSDAVWVSAWILERKEIQYSTKRSAWFDPETNKMHPDVRVIRHKAAKVAVERERDEIPELKSDRG